MLDGAGLVDAARGLRRAVGMPWLTVLCYHRTAEPITAGEVDDEVVDATPAQFDAQLDTLARAFRFVSLAEVEAAVHGASLPPNPLLVTFDDAYRDCVEVSLPILQRHGVPAAFFVPTMHVGERRLFWWDHLAWVLRHSTRERLELDYPRPSAFTLPDLDGRVHEALTMIVKQHVGLDLDRFVEGVERAAGIGLPRDEERRIVDRDLLDWDGVRALADAGMGVGSHTHSHRVLQTLAPDALERELGGSRRELERRLGRAVRSIAYPVGYPVAGSRSIRDAVRAAGYELGFSCRAGVQPLRGGDPLDVPRLLMEKRYDAQTFAGMTLLPALAPRTTIDLGWAAG
jgi:peptidoglycan/xylan/chitin deacetylase (PgdA/CDA1 family)